MRQIDQRLNRAPEQENSRLIQQQRQDNRADLIGHDLGNRNNQRVAEDAPELRQGEEKLKVLPADPGRAGESLGRAEVLESDDHTVHGVVAEEQDEDDARHDHDVQGPGASYVLTEGHATVDALSRGHDIRAALDVGATHWVAR